MLRRTIIPVADRSIHRQYSEDRSSTEGLDSLSRVDFDLEYKNLMKLTRRGGDCWRRAFNSTYDHTACICVLVLLFGAWAPGALSFVFVSRSQSTNHTRLSRFRTIPVVRTISLSLSRSSESCSADYEPTVVPLTCLLSTVERGVVLVRVRQSRMWVAVSFNFLSTSQMVI